MQEEVNSKTVALAVKAGKFTLSTFLKLIRAYLRHRKAKKMGKGQLKGKKMSVKQLSKKYDGLKNIELEEENQIKDFEKIAKKYNLEFAVKKDGKTTPPTYIVFFKGRDVETIDRALKDFLELKTKKKTKPSLMAQMKKLQEKAKSLFSDKSKNKHKEQSL